MIELAIMRHGEAAMTAPDPQRQLTEQGEQAVKLAAAKLNLPDQIWVSPYVRAQQTLACVQSVQASFPNAMVHQGLTPDASLTDLLHELGHLQATRLLLIGHNPLFSNLAASLSGEHYLALHTAGIARLRGDIAAPGCMTLIDII